MASGLRSALGPSSTIDPISKGPLASLQVALNRKVATVSMK